MIRSQAPSGELARRPSVTSAQAQQARIVLLGTDGLPNAQIAWTVGARGLR